MKIQMLDKLRSELYRARLAVFAVFAFCMGAVFAFLATSNIENTSATTAGFKAGNIMTDYVMSNSSTMSVADIQWFLQSKNPCDYRDYNKYVSLMNSSAAKNKGYSWHFENGHFICLAEERFDGQSAAQIIYDAAQEYHINPQVLIVLLEKEQGLITDKYPNNIQYRSATGFGCPDTAPCDAEYYGFKNQVRKAAWLFHQVLTGGWSNYHVGNNQIAYHPNGACGASNVYIENLATAALYRYTPYQPNGAALSWSGDGCSSYGNRNFYHYFTEWFGSTQQDVPIAKYQVIPDGVYTIVSDVTYNNALTAGSTPGSNVSMKARQDTDTQKWQVTYHSDDSTYSFVNKATGLALDIHGASTASGANVEVFTKGNNCNQKWRAVANNDGTVGFISACSTAVALDVYGASSSDGANVQSYAYHGEKAQRWRMVPDAAMEDGLYVIYPKHNEDLTLDVYGGYKKPETNVQVYSNHTNENSNEKWNLQYNKQDGTYKITSLDSGLALDVYGGYTKNGTNVQMYNYHGSCGQKWLIIPNGNGYTVASSCSGLSLDVYGAIAASGTNVQVWQQNHADNQVWKIEPTFAGVLADGVYKITAKADNNLILGVDGGRSNSNNVKISNDNSNTQKWKLTNNGDGTYFITNASSGLSLDVYGGYKYDEANVQVFTAHYGQNQKWMIERNADGSYAIRSVNSGKSLDVYGGQVTNDSNVQQFSWHGGVNQKWQITKE